MASKCERLRLLGYAAILSLASVAPAAEPKAPGKVVYWGNTTTGKAVRVLNWVGAEELAEAEKTKIGGTGWVLFENSSVPGYGAAICTKKGGIVRFHTAHGYATSKEAVRAARAKALAAGGVTYLCDKPVWHVAAESKLLPETSLIDRAKAGLRDKIVRSPADVARLCTQPQAQPGRARLRPIGNGTMPLKDDPQPEWKPPEGCPKPFLDKKTTGVGRRG